MKKPMRSWKRKIGVGLIAGASAMHGCEPIRPYVDMRKTYTVQQAPSVIEGIETGNLRWLAMHRGALEKKGNNKYEWAKESDARRKIRKFKAQRETLSRKIVEAKELRRKAEKAPEKYRQRLSDLLNEIDELHQDLSYKEGMLYYMQKRGEKEH